MRKIVLGSWNVRTLLDRDKTNRPERRTALVARELQRYNIDIAALSETRFPDEGSLREEGGGYTYFWKGTLQTEDRIHGVGFAIKSTLLKSLPALPVGINERLMKLRVSIGGSRYATIISAYAPTLTSSDDVKELFYQQLNEILQATSKNDKVILLGDFNARVGNDTKSWEGVLGPHGVGRVNKNGLLLLSLCAEHSLCITNTLFQMADKYKATWMHPRSKQWHLIDYVIVRQRDRKDVHLTRAMRGANCWTDHRLVRTVMDMHIKPLHRKKPKNPRASYNVSKLRDVSHRQHFIEALDKKLTEEFNPSGDIVDKWTLFKTTLNETAKNTLGPKVRSHQDWFDENDEEIKATLQRRNKAFTDWQNDPSSLSKKERFRALQAQVQRDLREMQDSWWNRKAEEVQQYADTHNARMFFSSLKAIYGPTPSTCSPLLSTDGNRLIKDQEGLLERWSEHFSSLLNRSSTVDPNALNQIPKRPLLEELDTPPDLQEIKKAIAQTSSGKASGKDNIPAEIYKVAGPKALESFHDIISQIWKEEQMPDDFRDALIVSLYKNKGSKADCGNYRGISLLSIAGKIFARVILNRLILVAESILPEAQCGFRPGRSTIDMIFAMRQIQEKCVEQNMPLYTVFIDLTKAFDTVNREALWTVLERTGCPPKFLKMIQLFHTGMKGQVLTNGNMTEEFPITNGVKQGCVLAPVLFNIFFTAMLSHACRNLEKGIHLKYRMDGSLFDLRRLQAKTKTSMELLQETLFADDCSLNAHSEADLQTMLDHFSEASKLFGLTISIGKTEVLHQPAPRTFPPPPNITIDGTSLNNTANFKYLGSTISADGAIDKEIDSRINKASQALGRLRHKVLNQHNIKISTKIKVYNAVVLSSLLYGSETWTLHRKHIKKLEQFHQRALRSILGIRWQDRVPNTVVLDRSNAKCIESLLVQAQLRWVGHTIRMEDHRMPKQLLYGELASGKRNQGRPRKRYKDMIKDNLPLAEIAPKDLESTANERTVWRRAVYQAKEQADTNYRDKMTTRREKRHIPPAQSSSSSFRCQGCNRLCASRIGLFSHSRACKP